ncbi:hypothetical protein AMES_8053 [Amycolatopsis mediterranei S699]|uniref:Peptidase inhibitor family I36 n=2 Tax=Amycolatopsis mediterranei TaxID=33910 RepID=A0A0H3DID0_AMYMU|nr:peptidase inhibitor family I36 protein [Amycolatopsis mediterranei]ADJ49878.1 hypothetical protein AMED_8178 [Amycolatopsis mediterranei U32]AEK46868.1 hypothetical protein RAM_42005 [Amycolatopsis mediterranei S699]AFO81586.1 hypothetical protein AMES_8053 [Amycolatopsis mediterranei S699]AGT88715.1 hypothetical protein B737_8054 [Amycolatopsis mediterranei RB]KDO07873.1 hypothetical protein DV26_26670 [Amycolatopsis mediterranei]
MMSKIRKLAIGAAAAATLMAAAAPAAGAAPAQPATVIHGCDAGYFCFYFNSNYAGARADYVDSDGNLDNETFNEGGTNGRGVQVKNNAASAVNNWAYYATVYYNSGCNGSFASQTFGAYASGNFNATMKNENASFKWPTSFGAYSDCANRDQF